MSVLGDLPEGVSAAMFLRDGWPDAVVCKVLMRTGCIGIGMYRRQPGDSPLSPADADKAAMDSAIEWVSADPPDYTEIHEHAAAMKEKADAARPTMTATQQHHEHADYVHDAGEEPDHDLQASLGKPAHG